MNFKVTAFTETKKLHYTRISAHVFVFIVFVEEEERLVDVYVNLLTCINDMYTIVSGYYILVKSSNRPRVFNDFRKSYKDYINFICIPEYASLSVIDNKKRLRKTP